jgi:uncharacterized phage infection (PIP) family protein YhgE
MKRLLLILSLVCFAISTWAGQISRDQALRKAQQFLSQKGLPGSLKSAETQMSRHRAQGSIQPDYYYIFNAGQDQGFVIVSGDDRTPEILGYSLSGSFDVDNLPPAMEALLNHYSEEIRQIQEGRAIAAVRRASHPSVAQMMTVKWGQDDPYNRKTMTGYYTDGKTFQCVTGCVATAMAQVLYHQHFVNKTQAEIPGYQNPLIYKEGTGYMNAVPAGTVLDWGNMVDSYNGKETEAQKDAVASLMMYCGVAVRMEYSYNASSASVSDIPEALKTYFGYSRGTRYVARSSYSAEGWDNLIYNEIASGRPVIYGGLDKNNGGHAFILHGYDGNGKYAINWGWGGYEDNYFMLDDLTPPSQGTGGGSGGYNYDQDAVIYLTKEDGTFKEDVIATVSGAAVGDVDFDNFVIPTGQNYQASRNNKGGCILGMAFTYTSDLANIYAFDLGYGIQNSDGNLMGDVVALRQKWDLKQGQNRTTATGTSNFAPSLSEGTYYIKAYSRENGTTDWSVCKDADKFAVKMVVSSSAMKFEVVDISTPDPEPQPEVTQAELDELAGLYAAQKTAINDKITAIASNDKKLSSIAQSLSLKKTAIESLETKISTIENKLKSEYLTASQKKTYNDELDALKAKRDAQASDYNAANQELISLQSNSTSLKATLNSLLTSVNTEAAKVSSITTAAALNASKTKVAEITSQQSDCNVSAETEKVTSLESNVAKISVTQVETGLASLESNIDAAIGVAKQAEQDEQENKKLEENKKALKESYDKLKTDLAVKQQNVTENENTIASLEADIKKAKDVIAPIEKKIAEIKESLKNDMLSADQKAKFQSRLEAIDKAKSTYADNLNALEAKLATAQKSNEELKASLETVEKLIDAQIEAIKNISTNDELSKAKADKQDAEAQLGKVNPADVGKVLLSLKTDFESLTLDGITKDLVSLESDIQQAIAVGEYEYEKQQAEKLAKAKEDFQKTVDDLESLIKAHRDYYNDCMEVQVAIKENMVVIGKAISVLKEKYSGIDILLQELIAKQTDNTSSEIEQYQKRLKELETDIAKLEEQYEILDAQISAVDEDFLLYNSIIESAAASSKKLQNDLTSAVSADDVEKLTQSAEKLTSEFSSNGLDMSSLMANNVNIVINNMNTYINHLNEALTDADDLKTEVEATLTDIRSVLISDSEVLSRYDLKGNCVDSTYKGVQVIRLKNGKIIKLYNK